MVAAEIAPRLCHEDFKNRSPVILMYKISFPIASSILRIEQTFVLYPDMYSWLCKEPYFHWSFTKYILGNFFLQY